jgi:hypothetical protein
MSEIKVLTAIPNFKIHVKYISIYENTIVYMTTSNDIIIHDNITNKTLSICWHNNQIFVENKEIEIGIICATKNYLLIGHESRLYVIPYTYVEDTRVPLIGRFDVLPNSELIDSIKLFNGSSNIMVTTNIDTVYKYNIDDRTFDNIDLIKREVEELDAEYINITSIELLQLTESSEIVYKNIPHQKPTNLLNYNLLANTVAYVDKSSFTILYTVPFNQYIKLDAAEIEWCSEKVPFVSPQEFIIDIKITKNFIIVMTYKNIYYRLVHDAVEWCLFTVVGNGEIAQPPRFKLINYENPQEPELFDDELPIIWSQLLANEDVIYGVSIDGYVFKLCPGEDDAYMLSKGIMITKRFNDIIDNYIFGEKYKIELIKGGQDMNQELDEL